MARKKKESATESLPEGKMRSKNPIFKDDPPIIDIPKRAVSLLTTSVFDPIYQCPYCGHMAAVDDCDVMGAEKDCLFCPQCNREFQT